MQTYYFEIRSTNAPAIRDTRGIQFETGREAVVYGQRLAARLAADSCIEDRGLRVVITDKSGTEIQVSVSHLPSSRRALSPIGSLRQSGPFSSEPQPFLGTEWVEGLLRLYPALFSFALEPLRVLAIGPRTTANLGRAPIQLRTTTIDRGTTA